MVLEMIKQLWKLGSDSRDDDDFHYFEAIMAITTNADYSKRSISIHDKKETTMTM
jgi:hypothetical protein